MITEKIVMAARAGLLCGVCIALASCTQVRPGVKTVNGAVVQQVAQPPEEVMKAAEAVFMDMGYVVATEKTDSKRKRITAHNAQGTRFYRSGPAKDADADRVHGSDRSGAERECQSDHH